MASKDNYFVVRTGLGVGTAALYADSASKTVAIGKTSANYALDVVGQIYSSDAIYAENNVGINTTVNYQELSVVGSAYISNKIGVGNTLPNYNLDISGSQRVTGLSTFTQSYTGIATVGLATIYQEKVGISTIDIAYIKQETVGISTIGNLYVTGVTSTAYLDVGVGGTVLKTYNDKIGIYTVSPTRTFDINGDLRVRSKIADSSDNVGFAYSVLAANQDGDLVWNPPGARIGNEWFVNKYGTDINGGKSPGDAFLTIKKACSIAQPGDTIRVFAGLYVENGPIQVPERVAVVGEDLRRTLVTTSGQTDLYHVRRGCYISHQSFVGTANTSAMVSFPTQGLGYADGTEQNWQSPYVQNCTNFVPNSIGMRIDGNRAGGFKSMVLDAYTQYNQGGIGVSITNFGYAQLVSLFTICCDTAVFCDTGGVCDMNNSNASFGNYGLVANGATPLQYTGTVVAVPTGDNVDSLVINVGAGSSQAFIDTVSLLRTNKEFIATEAVGFLTSTDGPYGSNAPNFDYGGSLVGRSKCIRDGQIIIESICSDLLNLGNINSVNAGLAYRDSTNGSITYLIETSPPPVGFSSGYVKTGEIALINYISGISTYVAQNLNLPKSYQSGISSISQVKDLSKIYSTNAKPFIASHAGIITSIIGIGTGAAPTLVLPQGQRPYDGQIAVVGTQYYFINKIVIDNPGSGYDPTVPVNITVDLPPNDLNAYFIPAEAAIFETNINLDGTISGVTLISSGTGYSSTPPNVIIDPPSGAGTQATAHAVMEKYFFNPVSSTPVSSGITTVTLDQFITYPVSIGDTVFFYQSSKIIASGITFEYIGTGINIVNAIPSKGAVTIPDNQIVATNGGKVPFTSTDQGGNFRISTGITINQNTGTITGQAFSKSLQSEVTPLIIALQQ